MVLLDPFSSQASGGSRRVEEEVELPVRGRLTTAPPLSAFHSTSTLVRGTRSNVIHEHILRLFSVVVNACFDSQGRRGRRRRGRGSCWRGWWERRLWSPHRKQQQIRSLLPTTIASAVLPIALALVGAPLYFHLISPPSSPHTSSRFAMFIPTVLALAFAAIPSALAQDFSAAHNVTPISGTWSSGSKKVVTGSVSAFWCAYSPLLTVFRASPTRRT